MEKQTAVEWLEEQYIKHSSNLLEMRKVFEQAKQTEKEQITQSHLEGQYHADGIKAEEIAQDYYDATYKLK